MTRKRPPINTKPGNPVAKRLRRMVQMYGIVPVAVNMRALADRLDQPGAWPTRWSLDQIIAAVEVASGLRYEEWAPGAPAAGHKHTAVRAAFAWVAVIHGGYAVRQVQRRMGYKHPASIAYLFRVWNERGLSDDQRAVAYRALADLREAHAVGCAGGGA